MVSIGPTLLRGLPRSARQALPILERGLREGLSSRSLTSIIRSSGIPISRTTVLRATRALRRERATITDIKLQPKDIPFDVSRFPESITRTRGDLSFKVVVRGIDANGQPVQRFVTVTTDDRDITLRDIEDQALGFVTGDAKYGVSEITGVETVSAKRRGA